LCLPLQHGSTYHLNLKVGTSGEQNLAPDGESIYRANPCNGVTHQRVCRTQGAYSERDLFRGMWVDHAEYLIGPHRRTSVIHIQHSRIERRLLLIMVDDI